MASSLNSRDESSSEGLDNKEGEDHPEVDDIPVAIPLSISSNPTSYNFTAQASSKLSSSFENLTIPVAIPVNLSTSKIVYAEVTSTSL